MIRNLIFLGAPGSGKGSTALEISTKYDIEHISTGEIFRNEIKNKTPLGLKVAEIVNDGKYVPDELTNQIVLKKLKELKQENKKFILDGYPRTLNQAMFLSSVLDEKILAVLLEVPTNLIIERLSFRRICPICKSIYHLKYNPSKKGEFCENHLENLTKIEARQDDSEESIKKRLKIYNEETKPMIDYYKKNQSLVVINSEESVKKVASLVIKKVFND
ncbi:adenylate kinase family protein [[Mycoplasma] mobile]|uniref:Adenylate kinase n=1 Tax=Mycoplasma mobile (strain ATCC 43663 / 163K / NCTC 11711) TaxID=267748 RepID=KAD_MYCM1|nr:nucleoside monophosphate kinase [[Mycoplasma] mobile]Q6KI35.1 RecName: Full=Adenylate kinase; Short=AK; AltName: Full=ATP-AMP transphosphorylase; AltName: Full=ATP:AMP phosphotransferase; AltName: Full=Adenylate monophosphate kinase [Mycoplasma mobile 163K]AAT27741.1 adenylate kinase [Mycoplasma mobile 163K]